MGCVNTCPCVDAAGCIEDRVDPDLEQLPVNELSRGYDPPCTGIVLTETQGRTGCVVGVITQVKHLVVLIVTVCLVLAGAETHVHIVRAKVILH